MKDKKHNHWGDYNVKGRQSLSFAKRLSIREISINDDIEILGHMFHGLKDIKDHVEMMLYGRLSDEAVKIDPKVMCDVHVGKHWVRYPCFDDADYATENRAYQNYIFRKKSITQEDMKRLVELPKEFNECRISENLSPEMLPMAYYVGDGDVMTIVSHEEEMVPCVPEIMVRMCNHAKQCLYVLKSFGKKMKIKRRYDRIQGSVSSYICR